MTHDEKIAHLIADLKAHGFDPRMANTPYYRVLHGMGILRKPPHFQPPLVNILLFTAFVLVVYPAVWIPMTLALFLLCGGVPSFYLVLCIFSFVTKLALGPAQAGRLVKEARKLKLPPWEDYPAEPPQVDEDLPEPKPHAREPDTHYRAKG
jgi:hypothetical protein